MSVPYEMRLLYRKSAKKKPELKKMADGTLVAAIWIWNKNQVQFLEDRTMNKIVTENAPKAIGPVFTGDGILKIWCFPADRFR